MIDAFLVRLRERDEVSADEEAHLRSIMTRTITAERGETVVHVDQDMTESLVLVEGIACRFKDLSNGNRQIVELNVAGDFIDLHAFLLKRIDHNICAMTPCTFASVSHDDLKRVTEERPHLTRLLWLMTTLDGAIHREWVVSLGSRPARARLAHLFVELNLRLNIGRAPNNNRFDLPLTQAEIGELTGLTPVHVNRTLKSLRESGFVTMRGGTVEIHDLPALEAEAEFDPNYLNLIKRPR